MRSIKWLKDVLAQDKEDVDLLFQKTKTIMEYTEDKLVSDGILPSSRVAEPWEWFEYLQTRKKVWKKVYKQRRQIEDTLTDIYDKCIYFFEVMIGRKKFAPKHLNLEQLRKLW